MLTMLINQAFSFFTEDLYQTDFSRIEDMLKLHSSPPTEKIKLTGGDEKLLIFRICYIGVIIIYSTAFITLQCLSRTYHRYEYDNNKKSHTFFFLMLLSS